MKQIKYSHVYLKMRKPNGVGDYHKQGKLVFIHKTRFELLDPEFVEYDTAYYDADGRLQHYELPKSGDCLVLVFMCEKNLMTTIRRSTPDKAEYYCSCVGKDFEFVQVEATA